MIFVHIKRKKKYTFVPVYQESKYEYNTRDEKK